MFSFKKPSKPLLIGDVNKELPTEGGGQKAKIGNFFQKKFVFSLLALIVVFIAVACIWFYQQNGKPKIPSQFSFEAVSSDEQGIQPDTTFILKSSQVILTEDVKKILKFDPPLEFDVKKSGSLFSAITSTFAKENETTFEIKPKNSLDADIYQIQITDPDYADREYSWAFQIKADFQVVSTFPRDKATQVPLNSGIEITFNRENVLSPENNFEISPATEGTFEYYNQTLVFLPKKLLEKTIYNVRIKKGIKAQGSDDVLSEDYVFDFETARQSYNPAEPYFNFQKNFWQALPDRSPSTSVNYNHVDEINIDIKVLKFTNNRQFIESYENSRKWEWGWSYYYAQQIEPFDSSGLQEVFSFKPQIRKVSYSYFVDLPQKLDPGYYLLEAAYGSHRSQSWLQVSSFADYFSITHDAGLIWIFDYLKRDPMSDVTVSWYAKTSGTQTLGSTDKEGLLQFKTPKELATETKGDPGPKFFMIESKGNFPFYEEARDTWGYRQTVSKGDDYWNYLSTDRSVYRPSDSLNFWGVLKGREKDIRQMKVRVGLYQGYYYYYNDFWSSHQQKEEPIVYQDIMISQFDTIKGNLNFKGVSPGYYQLQVWLDDKIISSASVQIESFFKPAYQIVVDSDKKAIFADEPVKFHVKAEFFDGTPASDVELDYTGYWFEEVTGELKLNQNGEGDFVYTPKYLEDPDTDKLDYHYYYPRNFSIDFSPKLGEEGEISGSASVLVFGPHINMDSYSENTAGDNYRFKTKINNIDISGSQGDEYSENYYRNEYLGEPVVNQSVSAQIIKTTYYKVEIGQQYDPINKIVQKLYDYRSNDETIERLAGVTDSKGEWIFERNLPQVENVSYRMIFRSRDSQGRLVRDDIYPYKRYFTSGISSSNGSVTAEFAFSMTMKGNSGGEQNEFSEGEKVKIATKVEGAGDTKLSKVLLYRIKSSLEENFVLSDPNFEEPFKAEFSPAVTYRAVILGPTGFVESNPQTAYQNTDDKKLNINITTDKESYRPGDQVRMDFDVRDKNNSPVAVELNIAAIDEALFHVMPDNWRPDLLDTLYSTTYVQPITRGSDFQEAVPNEGAERGGCFLAGTKIKMADGTEKPIEEIKIGDKVQTFADEKNSVLESAIVQGKSNHLVGEYLIINNQLRVSLNHRLFVNGKWQYAIFVKIGDELKSSNGQVEKVVTIERKDEKVRVYNFVVNKYHTYFAQNYYVHNEEKGGGDARSEFVDAAYFDSVVSSNNGRASVTFKAPDNVTSWRTTVLGFEPQSILAGSAEKLVKVSLPFFVDAVLSETYLTGDQPFAKLRAFGGDYQLGEETAFSVKSAALSLDFTAKTKDNWAYVSLGQLKEGNYEIILSATQGGKQDSIKKNISVVKSFFRTGEASYYTVNENLTNIAGNTEGQTKLVFADLGRGKYYQMLWSGFYSYGIRSDQMMTRYYASKLLADYFEEGKTQETPDLSGYYSKNGLTLFPYSDNDLTLSALMVDLAPDLIWRDNLSAFFNDSLDNKKTDIHRLAKAFYGLAGLKEPVLIKLDSIYNDKKLLGQMNLEDKIYFALALAKIGDKEKARVFYETEIKTQFKFQEPDAWLATEKDMTKQVKMTALAGILVSNLNIQPDSDMFWSYLQRHYPVIELDLLERLIIAKNELPRYSNQTAKFTYELNGQKKTVTLEKGRGAKLSLMPSDLASIKFSNIEGKVGVASYYEKYADADALAKNSELGATRIYLKDGQPAIDFSEGDVVQVRIDPKIARTALDGNYQIIDFLPSGLRPISHLSRELWRNYSDCNASWYPEKIVDNAVYFQIWKDFDNSSSCGDRATVNYYARVVTKGSYEANPALIQSLRDLNSLNVSNKNSLQIN